MSYKIHFKLIQICKIEEYLLIDMDYRQFVQLKVPTAGAHTRVYGRIGEEGKLIFDLLIKE